MEPFDVCVVGHITRDWVQSNGAVRSHTGGVAYYASLTLKRLGQRVAVVTRLAAGDRDELLAELREEGVEVVCGESVETSVFHCAYAGQSQDERRLTVGSLAEPFTPGDLAGVSADWFYLGPLTNADMSLEFVQAAATRGKIALDAQGLVRQVDGGVIRAVRPAELSAFLRTVSLLKVDESEAATLSLRSDANASARILCELGPDEVILTCGSRGSLIFDGARSYAIDAAAGELVDATGCGDTYLAAYLSRRLASDEPERAGHFAATAAAMALERVGAFRASEAEVRDRMV